MNPFIFVMKLLMLPVLIVLIVLEWIGLFLCSFSSVIFNLIAGLVFLLAFAAGILNVSHGSELLEMLTISFVLFLIPHIGMRIVMIFSLVKTKLEFYIFSKQN